MRAKNYEVVENVLTQLVGVQRCFAKVNVSSLTDLRKRVKNPDDLDCLDDAIDAIENIIDGLDVAIDSLEGIEEED